MDGGQSLVHTLSICLTPGTNRSLGFSLSITRLTGVLQLRLNLPTGGLFWKGDTSPEEGELKQKSGLLAFFIYFILSGVVVIEFVRL